MDGHRGRFHSRRNFVLQQGLPDPRPTACIDQFSALMFQPKISALLFALAVLLQSAWLFLLMATLLWWSALVPRLNPFDALHNATLGRHPGAERLGPAPPPRRFAQGMAGAFALAAGLLMLTEHRLAAVIVQAVLLIAVTALVLGNFCLGSFVYHLLGGRRVFALRTLPWARPQDR